MLRPRRSGGASHYVLPVQISGIGLWFDAADAGTISTATGVSEWADKSGNANHATQGTGSAQPTRQASIQNGLPAIRFTGSASQFFSLASAVTGSGGYTCIAALKRSGPTGTNQCHVLGRAAGEGFSTRLWSDDRLYHSLVTSYRTSNASLGAGVKLITTIVNSNNTGSQRVNGAVVAGADSAGLGTTTLDRVGVGRTMSEYGNFDLFEFAFWPSVLTTDQIDAVEFYLKSKWGIS